MADFVEDVQLPKCDEIIAEQLGWKGWVVMGTLVVGLISLIRESAGPDFVFMAMLALFMALRIVPVKLALDGFRNEGLLTVAVLFVVAAGMSETGGLNYFLGKALGQPSSLGAAYVRLMVPVAMISAFLNNTPVVAIMIPIIASWCQKVGLPPGQMFIPLSFASILGGTLTLVGTSTNLVVAGLFKDRTKESLGMFGLTRAGYPVAVSGLIYITLFARYLLPGASKASLRGRPRNTSDDSGE